MTRRLLTSVSAAGAAFVALLGLLALLLYTLVASGSLVCEVVCYGCDPPAREACVAVAARGLAWAGLALACLALALWAVRRKRPRLP